jgi:hypothetical protein
VKRIDNAMFEEEMSDEKTVKEEAAISPRPMATADLFRTAADPDLTEDMALALLKHNDLSAEIIESLAKNSSALKGRKVKIAVVGHPHTPRHISIPLARQFYLFDLMKTALSPCVPSDVKVAIDDVLISRVTTATIGERLTLARRASGRVAAALLLDKEIGDGKIERRVKDAKTAARESRVMQIALENPRLTEALVVHSVLRPAAGATLIDAVAQHEKWSRRREIRTALLRTEHLSLARALEFSREIPTALLRELLASSRLPTNIKEQLLRENSAK